MRIACIHVPQLSLQCATRVDPALRGAPVVVVGARPDGVKSGPVVLACSRAAWAVGARVGMLATAARGLSPELVVVAADPLRERETVRALADAMLALTPIVDLGGRVGAGGAHQAIYCEVPAKHKGASFGERLMSKLDSLGLSGRIGIADDRFTAWVAASDHDHHKHDDAVISVPRGGSAAFLAHRPLSLLSISGEVQHMLAALGVTTLGEFAALPEPSVARPLEADYQALARGEGERHMPPLRPYAPDAPIREEIAIARTDSRDGKGPAPSLSAAIGIVAERIALRLEGRGRGAAKLEITVTGAKAGTEPDARGVAPFERVIPIVPVGSAAARTSLEALLVKPGTRATLITGADALADTLAEALRSAELEEGVWRILVAVTGEAIVGEPADQRDEAETAPILDTLSVVLSTTGGSLDLGLPLGLPIVAQPAPTAGVLRDRAEAHRRTRKGKQRKRELPSVIQPKLFKG
jgi:nucleotidyltransferase/DNA polymerase involved in DNA repair